MLASVSVLTPLCRHIDGKTEIEIEWNTWRLVVNSNNSESEKDRILVSSFSEPSISIGNEFKDHTTYELYNIFRFDICRRSMAIHSSVIGAVRGSALRMRCMITWLRISWSSTCAGSVPNASTLASREMATASLLTGRGGTNGGAAYSTNKSSRQGDHQFRHAEQNQIHSLSLRNRFFFFNPP